MAVPEASVSASKDAARDCPLLQNLVLYFVHFISDTRLWLF